MTTVMRQFNFDELQLYKNRSSSEVESKTFMKNYKSLTAKHADQERDNRENLKTREAIGAKLISNESYLHCSPRRPVTTLNNTFRTKAVHFSKPEHNVSKINYKRSSMGSLFSKRSSSVLMNSLKNSKIELFKSKGKYNPAKSNNFVFNSSVASH